MYFHINDDCPISHGPTNKCRPIIIQTPPITIQTVLLHNFTYSYLTPLIVGGRGEGRIWALGGTADNNFKQNCSSCFSLARNYG